MGNVLSVYENKVGNFLPVTEIKMGNRGSSLPGCSKQGGISTELGLVPGLQNLGTNCFLNVVLQVMM